MKTIHRAVRRWFDGVVARLITPPPTASHPLGHRARYKDVWNDLASSSDSAKMHVAGYLDEDELMRQARATVDVLRRYMGFGPSDVVLEIGCGIGRVGHVLAPQCAEWIGTDISGNMLAVAADRLRGVPHVRLVELSQVGLAEIPERSVDRVYCTVVFMHLYEWDRYRYLREAFRVLRPGGRAYFDNVDVTSSHGWKKFMETAEMAPDKRPAHVSMVSTGDELETYARRAGFDDVAIHRFHDAWVAVTGTKTG